MPCLSRVHLLFPAVLDDLHCQKTHTIKFTIVESVSGIQTYAMGYTKSLRPSAWLVMSETWIPQ